MEIGVEICKGIGIEIDKGIGIGMNIPTDSFINS